MTECCNCDCGSKRDKLDQAFEMQEAYMKRLSDRQPGFPKKWPLDLSQKSNQIECRDLVFNSMGELFEVIQELKNSKKHRETEIPDLNREKLIEESVDAFKYFLEMLIFIGVTPSEFFEAYAKKDDINHRRLDQKY